MEWIGINYDTGTRYGNGPDAPSSCDGYDLDARLDADLDVIARRLHCNTVQLYGTDIDRLTRAAIAARSHQLYVWFQPRLVDAATDEHLDHLAEAAASAESVHAVHGGVVFSIGVELSLFLSGFVDGATVGDRIPKLFDPGLDRAELESALDGHLAAAETGVRERFAGPVCYGSGMWEPVRWDRRFDLVGIDLYVRPIDEKQIIDELASYRRAGKPVVVTEYGCVTHAGGLNSFGADVVDWSAQSPKLADGVERSEVAQADGIGRQFEAIRQSGADGALCFAFLEPRYCRSSAGDIDAASFGITRALDASAAGEARRIEWSPKVAFDRLADLHCDVARAAQ